ncbi:hypothetical protein [Methanoculleus bourgensis]|uniref:Uncharacterized protein n=1 Tax=Methanoculleus bourgensis TaxID=83986 RepID=A0A0X3BJ72_9EURY|nr:hypothetical protein [Methanoculleus bourgensis]CVK31949.1 protein of unknown function [Methanoculleus bourgensis]
MPAMPCTAMMHATDIRAHSSDPGKTEWYEVGLEQILKGIWPAFGEISPGPFHRCAKNASTRPSVTASTRANPTRPHLARNASFGSRFDACHAVHGDDARD